jgi:hypothetical protein
LGAASTRIHASADDHRDKRAQEHLR